MFKKISIGVALLACLGVSQASLVNTPVPSNAYITFKGLDWAWASPVAYDGSFGAGAVDLSVQGGYGWRIPTLAELVNAPQAQDFVFKGANVPYLGVDPVSGASNEYGDAGGDMACASPYFNNTYSHCDFTNGLNGGDGIGWYGTAGAPRYAESLMVRGVSAVPEPETYAMLFAGLGVLGFVGKRRKAG